jgi:hypothetical protein
LHEEAVGIPEIKRDEKPPKTEEGKAYEPVPKYWMHATGRANSPAVNHRGGEFAKLFPPPRPYVENRPII